MRTNIVIDDQLIERAFTYAQVSTKRELIDLALREFVENHQRRDIRDLKNRIHLREDYDYKALRTQDNTEE